MKITLLITSFNSSSQIAFCALKDMEHTIDVVYAMNPEQMEQEVSSFQPDIIISPFLKKFIPDTLYSKYPCFVLHPGIRGDRGAYSLDNAIREDKREWGVVYLKANDEYDCGAIYAEEFFSMRKTYKASLYRNEVNQSSIQALKTLLSNIEDKVFLPILQDDNIMHKQLTQDDRSIDWIKDTTAVILKKIYMSDSHPGVKDEILGVECYLYGAHNEQKLRGKHPKEILAKRDGAICLATIDGAVWITHLKEIDRFKLPATYVLKEKLLGIKEDRLPLVFDKSYETFYEISCEINNDIAYLYFDFHNGAFSSEKCMKLKYAFEYIKTEAKVVVLMGGKDFFSNGIHLNILEDSKKNGEDGWSNINAMNDLVKSILFADDVITVASFEKNSGAGGVFLALACDYVLGSDSAVLNPHYKTLGLSGSEYHSYTLPKRVGSERSMQLLDECLPLDAKQAKEIGMIDEVYISLNYKESLDSFCNTLLHEEEKYEDFLWDKEEYLEENRAKIEQAREQEIDIMYPEFWEEASSFHTLRYEFVYKVCPLSTPKRLKAIINE